MGKCYALIPIKCFPQRKYMSVMCCVGLLLNYTMRFTLSMTRPEMVRTFPAKVDPSGCNFPRPAGDVNKKYDFDWDPKTQGFVMSSFFWGYFITQIPGGMISDTMGGKSTVVLSTLVSAVITVLTPFLASFHVWALIGGRVCLGLVQGFNYAAYHSLVAKWIPKEERSLWGAITFMGAQLGMLFCTLCTGLVMEYTKSWRTPFWVCAACSTFWAICFQFTCTSNHFQFPYLSEEEQRIMDEYAEKCLQKNTKRPPMKRILKSVPVWSFVIAMIGHDWGIFATATDVPKYLDSVMALTKKDVGLFMALGYFIVVILALVSGYIDRKMIKKGYITMKWSRIVLTTIAGTGQAIFLILSAYTGCNRDLAITMLVLSIGVVGTFYASLKIMPIDLSPNFSGTIGAMGHGLATISGILAPYIINYMTPNSTRDEWRHVFILSLIVMVGTNIIYIFTMSAEVQPWNTPED